MLFLRRKETLVREKEWKEIGEIEKEETPLTYILQQSSREREREDLGLSFVSISFLSGDRPTEILYVNCFVFHCSSVCVD